MLDYLSPFVEPAQDETFRFTRAWMREQFERINNPRKPTFTTATKLNLPPSYLLIHRTWLGGIGVLSQLEAEAPFRAIMEEHLPGSRPTDAVAATAPPPRRSLRFSGEAPEAQKNPGRGNPQPPPPQDRSPHHVQPDEAVRGRAERPRHGPDDPEPQRLPQATATVGLDDGVELDAAVALLAVPVDDVRPQPAADAPATGRRRDHERGGADVVAPTRPVRPHLGRAEQLAVLLEDDRQPGGPLSHRSRAASDVRSSG